MKIYVFVILGCCSNIFGYDEKSYGHRFDRNNVDNPDVYAKITRPCKVSDLNCISKYFANNAHCTIPLTPLPDVLTRKMQTLYMINLNATVTHTNDLTRGLRNSRVEEFYLNKATNNAVVAVEFRNISSIFPSSYFNFYRNGQEPVSVVTNASIFYSSFTVTAVIPNIHDLDLSKAEITCFVSDIAPPFTVGPEVLLNPNPTVQQGVVTLVLNVPTALQELMFTSAPFYLISYIQSTICDFGLKYS